MNVGPMIFDDGKVNPKDYGLLQLFVPCKFLGNRRPNNAVSASLVLDETYDGLEEATKWAIGKHDMVRMFIDLEGKKADVSPFVHQIKTYSDIIYSFMETKGVNFMFINYRPVREFYMYYTIPRLDHDLDFCDNGYHYFEIYDIEPEVISKMLAVLLTVSRPGLPNIPTITAGEISYHVDEEGNSLYKMKIMPEVDVEDISNLEEMTDLPFNKLIDECKVHK